MALADPDSRRLAEAASAVATIASDYEPAGGISRDGVLSWAEQFDRRDRATIVHELASILSQAYVSKATMRNLLRRLLDRVLLTSGSAERELEGLRFLDVQRQGVSQSRLLELMDEVLEERGLCRRSDGDLASTYVYLDDGVHTGNAIRYDLTSSASGGTPSWIPNNAPHGCRLWICVVGLHTRGWDRYAQRYVEEAAAEKEIEVRVAQHLEIADDDRYLPVSTDGAGTASLDYVAQLEKARESKNLRRLGYLRSQPSSGLCESREGRRVLERAFLDVGADLRRSTKMANQRPLGYDTLDTLGFGSPLITYRNIPNTAPLALWYGRGSLFPRA